MFLVGQALDRRQSGSAVANGIIVLVLYSYHTLKYLFRFLYGVCMYP